MKKELVIRMIYYVTNRTFNVGSQDGKSRPDIYYSPNRNRYIQGSGDNVKHCISETLVESGYEPLERMFVRNLKKSNDDGDQNAVTTIPAINKPMLTLGCWQNLEGKTVIKKGISKLFKSSKITSSVSFGYFTPLNPDTVVLTDNVKGSCKGRDTDYIACCASKDDATLCADIDSMSNHTGLSKEVCADFFNKNNSKSNFIEKNPTVTGLYEMYCTIDMERFCTYPLSEVEAFCDKEEIESLLKNGWSEVTIGSQKCIRMPLDIANKLFADLCKALHVFDFRSNKSRSGQPIKLIRSVFGFNAHRVSASTIQTKENGETNLEIRDGIDGVFSFNMPSEFITKNTDNLAKPKASGGYEKVVTDINADELSLKRMIEVGTEYLKKR